MRLPVRSVSQPPIVTIINVVLVVVFVLYLLSAFFGARTGISVPLHR